MTTTILPTTAVPVWLFSQNLDGTLSPATIGTGSGTVNSGTAGQLAWFATTGTAVSGNANANMSNGQLTLGSVGTGGVLALAGSTSGSATFTAPAVAGTSTNPVSMSNTLFAPSGSSTNPSYAFSSIGGSIGIWYNANAMQFQNGVGNQFILDNAGNILGSGNIAAGSGSAFYWGGSDSLRDSGGIIASNTIFQATRFNTTVNCSSAASPAVCTSASAGSVTIAAAATTITVNTSAVTANSQIFLLADDTLGTKLGVTCNSTLATLIGGLAVTARSAGVSFQITSGATPAVNPLCLSYFIVN